MLKKGYDVTLVYLLLAADLEALGLNINLGN